VAQKKLWRRPAIALRALRPDDAIPESD
jgi:hypothetical protein